VKAACESWMENEIKINAKRSPVSEPCKNQDKFLRIRKQAVEFSLKSKGVVDRVSLTVQSFKDSVCSWKRLKLVLKYKIPRVLWQIASG
jgi:hypothetical protein